MSRLLSVAIAALIAVVTVPLAAQQPVGGTGSVVPKVLAVKAKQSALTVIQGNALDSTNAHLTNTTVRLRDARFGRIVDTQVTDKSGLFAFRAIDPGSYVVEIVANDQSILAASQLLNVNAGEAISAVVKLPFRIPALAGLVGSATPSSAAVVATQAAVSSIAAVVPTTPVSPNQ
jgi:PDZ domain-containing secreted protein